jgi:glycosyltransferase 2 family protein
VVQHRPGRSINRAGLGHPLRWLVGTAISVALLYLAARGVSGEGIDWHNTWQTIIGADLLMLGLALCAVILATWLKAVRWRLMFYPHHRRLHIGAFFTIFLIGQVVNAVIPARLGEVARALLIGERERVSKAQALWTAVVEKVLDTLTLLVFLAALSLWVPLPPWLQQARWTLSVSIAILIAALIVAARYRERFLGWLERWVGRRQASGRASAWTAHLVTLTRAVLDSLLLMRQPRLFGGLALWSVLAFLAAAWANWLTGRALGIEVSYGAGLLVLAVLQISAVVPIPTSPGRIGLFHYLCVLALAIFNVPGDQALSYGLVLHLVTYLPMAVGGPLGLWLQSYRWRDISHWLDIGAPALSHDSEGSPPLTP